MSTSPSNSLTPFKNEDYNTIIQELYQILENHKNTEISLFKYLDPEVFIDFCHEQRRRNRISRIE